MSLFKFSLFFLLFACSLTQQLPSNHYKVVSIRSSPEKLQILAQYKGPDLYYHTPSNPILFRLNIEVLFLATNQLRVLIKDALNSRFEIPEEDPFPQETQQLYAGKDKKYRVFIRKSPFAFEVKRASTNETLFDTSHFSFICSDRFFEFSSVLPSENIFGLGERVNKFKLSFPGVYTIWNRDLAGTLEDGETGGLNTYGMYPLYLMRERRGFFHMTYLKNSNGMDLFLNNTIIKTKAGYKAVKTITYRIVGGIIDLRFFIGEKSPEEVVRMWHQYIGGYVLQPFWSFGFHQCRYGYKNLSMIESTLEKYQRSGMPLDTIWIDIDYMFQKEIFTIDQENFNSTKLNYMVEEQYKKKLVLIIDPGVAVDENYAAYTEGIKKDLFIKNAQGTPLKGCVWPGLTHFPDHLNPETREYWADMFDLLYKEVRFSGIWLDMNELSDFVNGEVGKGECARVTPIGEMVPAYDDAVMRTKMENTLDLLSNAKNQSNTKELYDEAMDTLSYHMKYDTAAKKCEYPTEDYYYVYNPGGLKLDQNTPCLNAKHYEGKIEYDVHNFNGFLESVNTYHYLKDRRNQSLPFVMSRSTTPGSGKYTIHWTGDNVSTFKWMKLSIAGLINFNIFGIPNVGADVCGFLGNTTEELCSRWMQLGSLYPFSRGHNDVRAIDQDPFAFGETLFRTSMAALKFRYSILKYYYYLFVRNRGVGTVMRPLFFEFPEDKQNYHDEVLDQEFLLGNDLLVTPVLDQGITVIRPYFPDSNTVWHEIHTGETYQGGRKHFIKNELNETAPVFLRSGSSIFRQNVKNVTNSEELGNGFYLSAALERKSRGEWFYSKGQIMGCEDYADYGKLEKCVKGDCMIDFEFKVRKEEKTVWVSVNFLGKKGEDVDVVYVEGIDLYGLEVKGEKILVENVEKTHMETLSVLQSRGEAEIRGKKGSVRVTFGEKIGISPGYSILIKMII